MAKFYTFSQNNSGGSFVINKDISEYVIIEAENCSQANDIAVGIGIYFDGCNSGSDCSCCGDRWYEQWDEGDGKDVPMIYGTPLSEYKAWIFSKEYRIHYLDGRIEAGDIEKEER